MQRFYQENSMIRNFYYRHPGLFESMLFGFMFAMFNLSYCLAKHDTSYTDVWLAIPSTLIYFLLNLQRYRYIKHDHQKQTKMAG
jgi:hypothetical protein